jgi:HEAT repeat protein
VFLAFVIGAFSLTSPFVLSGCGKSKPTNELIEDLKSNDEADRVKAVRFLQHRKGDAAKVVPALIESLKDEHADIRWSAAIGLGYFGHDAKEAIPSLEKSLKDSDGRVRNAARVAISRIQE